MQNRAVAIPRLGIPEYNWWNEALHGVARSGYATVFPQAIGMAATWDVSLIHREADVISTEARAKYRDAIAHDNHSIYYGLDFWSPNINIFRDPRWGRGQETYGEDPFLTAQLGVAFVKSMQGNNPRYFKVIATPKHFAVHSGPESLRHSFDVRPSPYDLEDTYLPAFRATITEGHADSIMCAYNAIDGEPACANTNLLVNHLRQDWHFRGYVTSDCAAVEDISGGHKFAPTLEDGSVAAVKAGTDTTCGKEYTTLVDAVHSGKIDEAEIDKAVRNLFEARLRLGMFDPPTNNPWAQIPVTENDTPQHRALALEAARKSIVLLKNENHTLPLAAGVRTIAVVGPNAANLTSITGNYTGTPSQPVTPLRGMEAYFAGKARVLYAQGSAFTSELPVTVPRTLFHPAAGDPANGLKAEYFANADLSGAPVVTRIDQQLNFSWQGAAPVPGTTAALYSVRWTGVINTPSEGDYAFKLYNNDCYPCDSDEQVRVFIDGVRVFSGGRHVNHIDKDSFNVRFDGVHGHDLRVEYVHNGALRGGGISLEWRPDADSLRSEAVKVARQADVVVAFVGLSPDLEGEEMPVHVEGFSGGDRTDIQLPRAQRELLESLAATGKPLVVVLMNGSALAVNWAKQHAAAILEAWYPGEEGGTAIAQT
ncbi:MAG: glycoside hydrolase family 3 C-terminal domain-containing protein, partial [Acidobacteriota bacterium]|nr:glycoside hydrolase family 3 C-terminal domain-containing protein [Acidobacteriota bacterium]